MTADNILDYCLEKLEGTVLVNSWGECGIFYNPDGKLKRGMLLVKVKKQVRVVDRENKNGQETELL